MMIRRVILFFTYFLQIFVLSAQTECLKKAQRLFDDGQLEQVPIILEPCFKNFTREEQSEAYKLLTITWLYLDQHGKADTCIQKLLKVNPDFSISSAEDQMFLNLYNQYQTRPRYSLSASTGTIFSYYHNINEYGIYNLNLDTKIKKSTKPGYRVGLSLSKLITNKLNLNIGILYQRNNYHLEIEMLDFARVNFTENQTKLALPLSLEYNFTFRKLEPYLSVGFSTEYLLKSTVDASRDFIKHNKEMITGASINMRDCRNIINYSIIAGCGIKYKVRRAYLFFDLKYMKGLRIQNKPEKRYSNNDLVFNYYFIENDFRLDMLSISVGYAISIYKPIKLKELLKKDEL